MAADLCRLLFAADNPFLTANYNPIDHLNILFGHPTTVSALPAVSRHIRSYSDELSASITALETAQAYGSGSSLERMQSAQAELASVFARIEDVRSRAVQTEQDITTMTADIKRLDGTKRNLTVSMTALKRLQMLTTAYEQLRGLANTRQYRECAGLLQAVLQLMRHFNSYRSIEQIAVLSRGVGELQRELLEQVCEDFEVAFAKDEVATRSSTLVEACLVMDALGDTARARLVTWYVNTELREYRQVFRGNDEAGSLDNIGRRYAWFRRMLKTYEDEHAALFPSYWRVNEALSTAFLRRHARRLPRHSRTQHAPHRHHGRRQDRREPATELPARDARFRAGPRAALFQRHCSARQH